ncbi:ketoacyl-ACP synthase III [Paenibacillus piri]|uniref:Beta-ketoacyl-[acyl-carrier-protein] synthase III n=1 Tax=Paenibacillus piri TaxID=2547395 RepID=A0A4R5KVQ2_9BACL|nr:ketoacyl-ACP synthase III [Paenibacillus piri]TDF99195.1 ketoacyl-ACP synthase III [Paenibacillus piri]
MSLQKARITAIGTYVPERILTNQDLEGMVDTSNEWIIQRTGIRERRISGPEQYTSDLGTAAVQDLMHRFNKRVDDVDLIIVATSTPDFPFPSVAALMQDRLGIPASAGVIDLSAACAGFVYALHTANGFIASGLHRKVLVVGADTLSRITDYTDRTTCVLFGDGAGAALVERDDEESSFEAFHLGTDGKGAMHVYRTGLANKLNGVELQDTQLLVQNGKEVFRWAVRTVPDGMKALMDKSSLSLDQVDWFIPHSANLRIIEPVCEKSGFPIERTLYSLVQFGNTSAATIPLSLDLGIRDGRVHNGDRLLLYGFGAGLTHAGLLLKLRLDPQIQRPEIEYDQQI